MIKVVMSDIGSVSSGFKLCYTPRMLNGATHALAKSCYSLNTDCFCVGSIPGWVKILNGYGVIVLLFVVCCGGGLLFPSLMIFQIF